MVNPAAWSRYSRFGIVVSKAWLFQWGGRPVIYQPDSEYGLLPRKLRWRHVRYEPGEVDFTWEREWRINCDELRFGPADIGIVVPDQEWAERLMKENEIENHFRIQQYMQLMDESLAQQYIEPAMEPVPWRFFILPCN